MELTEIASISGKGGLFKVVKPGNAGVLLESLDAAKTKVVAGAAQRMSLLSEISIYTTTKEGTVALQDVLKKINKDFGNDLGVDVNSDANELKSFLKSVLPEYDQDRVYVSDIKKLVKWYSILHEYAPEIFVEKSDEAAK
jgi:glutamate-1-semialdehyde aminotransferase